MNELTFSEPQRRLLQQFLKNRIELNSKWAIETSHDKAGQKRFKRLYINSYMTAFEKVKSYATYFYDSKEKLAMVSCINEHRNDFYNELRLPTAQSWLSISNEQRQVISKLDDCKEILVKCGFYNQKRNKGKYDVNFRYSNFVSAVDKMKNADKIFLSCVGETDFYKIAFVHEDKEYVPFELKHQVSWKDFQFISLKGKSPDEFGKEKFSMITTKRTAKKLLATCEKKYYPEGVLLFMDVLLN